MLDKEKFYFLGKDGVKHFRCVFCRDEPVAGHSSEYEYDPAVCIHPEIKKLAEQGILCSNCFNWDFDIFKRHGSATRSALRDKSGRLLAKSGWLDEQHNTIDNFFK